MVRRATAAARVGRLAAVRGADLGRPRRDLEPDRRLAGVEEVAALLAGALLGAAGDVGDQRRPAELHHVRGGGAARGRRLGGGVAQGEDVADLGVVEHDMHFVRELGVKVTCLHEGSVLSEGTLDHVSADPRVVEVYLGR